MIGLLLPCFAAAASPNGELCTSPAFREAFLDGAPVTVHEDYTSLSPALLAYGDRAIPCLKTIVAGRAHDLGIAKCEANPAGCRSWALGAIGKIGTPTAKKYLIDFLGRSKDPHLLKGAALSLANLRADEARPALLTLLKHPDIEVRGTAVLALGVIGNRDDFDAMLAATLSLPPRGVYTGAMGLVKLGDPRAIQPLEDRLKATTDPEERRAIEDVLKQFKSKDEVPSR
jgi:hypothetical protein